MVPACLSPDQGIRGFTIVSNEEKTKRLAWGSPVESVRMCSLKPQADLTSPDCRGGGIAKTCLGKWCLMVFNKHFPLLKRKEEEELTGDTRRTTGAVDSCSSLLKSKMRTILLCFHFF